MKTLLSCLGQEVKFYKDKGVLRRHEGKSAGDYIFLECNYHAPSGEFPSLPIVCSHQFYEEYVVNDNNEIVWKNEIRGVAA